jgi:hypothetical protein
VIEAMAGACALVVLTRALLVARVLLVAAAVVLVVVGSARAGLVHPFVGSFSAGVAPGALAVDQASGDVLAVDVGAGAILKFDSSGNPSNFSALGSNVLDGASGADATPHGGFAFDSPSAAQVAVDNSGGPADGNIYVASLAGVVDVFDATGTFVGEIDGSAASPLSGGELCGIAVDPGGDVYASYFSGHVDKYTPTDATPADDTFDGQFEGVNNPCNDAADGLGNVYASTWSTGPLTKYDASQLNQSPSSGTVLDGRSLAVATDPSTNDVYADEGDKLAQFDSTGTQIGQTGKGTLSGNSQGVAIHGSSGDVYASENGQIFHFGPAITIPSPVVTIDPPSSITTSHATFSGTVNPNGTDPLNDTSWHFEYSTDGGTTWTNTTGGDVGTGTSPVAVSDEIDTLLPHQSVKVRLVASNAGGTTTSAEQDFDTPTLLPDVVSEPAQDITPDHAALIATLNAHNAPTTYYFEYGTTTAYGTSVPAGQNGDGGSSPDTIGIQQPVYGLQAHTTYHYRIVAYNQAGTVHGADQTFTTTTPPPASAKRDGIPGTGFLPDNRGWEQASPPDKNGGGVLVDSARVRAATTETPAEPIAATFGSLNTFADVHGTGVGNDYMAIRTNEPGTNGWTTHGITPPQQPLSFPALFQGLEVKWRGDFSPDLDRGVISAWSSLTSEGPNVNDVVNLYRRTDLRTPGIGTYELLTNCTLCTSPLSPITDTNQLPQLAGASADFSHVIFESIQQLVAGSTAGPGHPNLYEWDNGMLRLAGILPNGTVAPSSIAGSGAGAGSQLVRSSPHAISADGSRIIFTDTSTGDGNLTGDLYMRIDGSSTVQINASEKTPPQDTAAPALFQTASSDGARVFFTTGQQLTDDPTGGNTSLYMWDANAPAGHRLTLISADHEPADPPNSVQGVIGASDDGHYVYFVAAGQLVAGQPRLAAALGIYEWHDGVTSFIGKLANLNATNDESADTLPNFFALGPMAARVSPDGLHVLLQSSTGDGLTGYNSEHHVELYLYNADSHVLQCVSCRPDGSPAGGDAGDTIRNFTGGTGTSSHLSHPMSDDGRRVVFHTTDSLVPQDTNGKSDVYEFDARSGTVHLISSGKNDADSYFMDADASGNNVFFATREPLVGWDTDQSYDLYDARVDGGVPQPVSPIPCVGDPCQGPLQGAPGVASSNSETVAGRGNVRSSRARLVLARPGVFAGSSGLLRVRVSGKGRLTISGRGLVTEHLSLRKAGSYRVRVVLTASARRALRRHRHVRLKVRLVFVPSGGGPSSTVTASLTFRSASTRRGR